jgi:hypothetical protein
MFQSNFSTQVTNLITYFKIEFKLNKITGTEFKSSKQIIVSNPVMPCIEFMTKWALGIHNTTREEDRIEKRLKGNLFQMVQQKLSMQWTRTIKRSRNNQWFIWTGKMSIFIIALFQSTRGPCYVD